VLTRHQQRFAAARGIPESDLSQVGKFVGRNLVLVELVLVEFGDKLVQVRQKFVRVTKEAVEVNLGEQEREPLEILPANRVHPSLVQLERVLDDVLVVPQQQVTGKFFEAEQMLLENGEEFVVVILVESFELRRLERLSQLLEALFVKEPENPLK
jgi:hypothetical protein